MFNYTCQECHKGTVRETRVKGYQTRFDRVPFTVPEAIIGICDKCGAEHHNAGEYKHWRALFEAESQKSGRLLSAREIGALRERLGLSKSDFAALLGTTRQSVYWWEREDRDRPQSLAYDNMLRGDPWMWSPIWHSGRRRPASTSGLARRTWTTLRSRTTRMRQSPAAWMMMRTIPHPNR